MDAVDQYVGGRTCYPTSNTPRFYKSFGYKSINEPFDSRLTQGMVCHNTFQNDSKAWVYPEDVKKRFELFSDIYRKPVVMEKLSQCQTKNVIDPESIINTYGGDSARWFMLSDSPPKDINWTDSGINGAWKICQFGP